MFTITRRIEIDAGHRIPDHASKCKSVHGHRYVIEASCTGSLIPKGEQRAMVMDFGFLKDVMVEKIHDPCDHGLILSADDPILINLFLSTKDHDEAVAIVKKQGAWQTRCITGKLYVIKDPPTAEVLAEHWYHQCVPGVYERGKDNARLIKLRVWETPNCWAEYPT